MAKTVTIERVNPLNMGGPTGDLAIVKGTIDITSYTAEGESLTAAEIGLTDIEHISITPTEFVTNILSVAYASSKIRLFDASAEVTGATDMGTFSFVAYGTSLTP